MEKTTAKKTGSQRARTSEGTFQGDDPSTPDKNEAWVEAPEGTEPKEVEVKVTPEDEAKPAPAPKAEKVQTDVRTKLAKKTDGEDVFVPTTPPQLEADAKALAQDSGFEFNRGTSIGARLMARARQQFPR
jgi:hypothetical protein